MQLSGWGKRVYLHILVLNGADIMVPLESPKQAESNGTAFTICHYTKFGP